MANEVGPHVVIIGGGFGGIYAAKALARAPVRITLIDRRNHHLFQPLLYQVATAALNPSDIAAAIRAVLRRQQNLSVVLGKVVAIEVEDNCVVTEETSFDYDYLIVAPGLTHSYFGHDEWAEHAPGLKTIEDALEIRRRILLAFEAAERAEDPGTIKSLMTFVVVGGGPTGVELAGALAEIATRSLARDFRRIDTRTARVILVEGLPRILSTFPEELSASARRQLERLGVDVRLDARVTAIDEHGVALGDERIEARTVLWAAGVHAVSLLQSLRVPLDRMGRVLVDPQLTIPGHDEVLVIGDAAAVETGDGWVPGVAPAAIQQGRHVAENVRRMVRGEGSRPFRYRDKGMLATIGRAAAVADLGRLRYGGWLAWISWLVIHIFFLIGFRNRVLVIIQWAWAYLTWRRGAQLITGEQKE